MLIKKADDLAGVLDSLQHIADSGAGVEAKRAAEELRIRKAGAKGEAESAYLIDFDYAKSPNWAVIHDLRVEHDGRTAQIDHLLLNRWMEVYVLESKHFHAGIKITEDGEFMRWNNFHKKYEGMASPLEQNDRHIAVLRDVMASLELPTRLGIRLMPSFYSFVLVSPQARIDRPKKFDASRVIKADQLRKSIWKDIDNEGNLVLLAKTTKLVSADTVEFLARQLAALHVPSERPRAAPRSSARPAPVPAAPSRASSRDTNTAPGPVCKGCSKSRGSILYGKFGYYFKCSECDANTAIRFTCEPGHNPRLRKEKDRFFKECAECGSTALFFSNVPAK